MTWLENTTKKQSWLMSIAGVLCWLYVGWVLCIPMRDGTRPIANVPLLVAYFGTFITIIGATVPQMIRSLKDKKAANGNSNGEAK